MKIKYNRPNNLFAFIYDSYFIAGIKKKLLKTKKYPYYNSFKKYLITFEGYVLLLVFCLVFYLKTGFIFASIMSFIITFMILAYILYFGSFFNMYLKTKKKDLSGNLLIDKSGITDEDNNTKITFKWESISYIIIGNHSLNIFLVNQAVYLRLPIDIKEELLKEITKYSDIEIIDLTIND